MKDLPIQRASNSIKQEAVERLRTRLGKILLKSYERIITDMG
jgi:hypothetical protein